MNQIKTDIAIVGGGPIGLSMANLLLKLGLHVTLIDKINPLGDFPAALDGRTIAIAYGTTAILKQLDVWEKLLTFAQPIQEIQVSNGKKSGHVHYGSEDTNGHPMGYNIEIKHLRDVLVKTLENNPSLTIIKEAEVLELHPLDNGIILKLNDQEVIAKLCLGTDGKFSKIRELSNIKSFSKPYQQTAIVFNVKHEKPHNNTAYEHFLPRGPFALLPMLGDYKSSVIWSESSEAVEVMKDLKDAEFNQEILMRFGNGLGKLEICSPRWTYPLTFTYVTNYIGPRVALVGDAAHVIHPVAGQGLNLGFRDVEVLANEIKKALHLGLALNDSMILEKYQRSRRLDIASMSSFSHGMVKLFSNNSPSLGFLRGVGLDLVNSIPFLRKKLAHHAMGLKDRLS